MKKLLLILLFASGISATAQLTVLEDSFDTYPSFGITGFGNWQVIDVDLLTTYGVGTGITWPNNGAAQAFMVFEPSATTPPVTNATNGVGGETESRNFTPRTGLKYAACWASSPSTTGGATANNDWLVSPVMTLGATNNELTFWVKSMSDTYGLEKYKVGIYTGSGTPTANDFTIITGIPPLTAPYGVWELKTFSLDAYSNQTIRVGIKCQTADAYMFMVDDFKVTSSTLKVNEFFSNKFTSYPNPANNVVTLSNDDNILVSEVTITDMNGRTIKTLKVNNLREVAVNVSDLNSGIYMMNIVTDSGKAVKKFIKN